MIRPKVYRPLKETSINQRVNTFYYFKITRMGIRFSVNLTKVNWTV